MNATELKAYDWLKSQGYTGINFGYRRTPDFIVSTGEKFEVKKARNNTIWFGPNQFPRLFDAPETVILVFNDGNEPIAQIPFNKIRDGQQAWGNIRILKEKQTSLIKLDDKTYADLTLLKRENESYGELIDRLIYLFRELEQLQKVQGK